jgi:hypothetical protein
MIRSVKDCACGNRCEGNTDNCASCNQLARRSARVKPSDNNSPINKFSVKGGKVNNKYLNRMKSWKRGKKCQANFKHECSDILECHHMAGRSNDAFHDEWAEENGIVLTLDERFWMPLCSDAHRYVTENSKWAWENGYSFKRVSDPIFRIQGTEKGITN